MVRVSGNKAADISASILGEVPPYRFATYTTFRDSHGVAIDTGIAIFFSGPNSFTGEDVLELQGHGGSAVLLLVLQHCLELGARLAQPGEFTQRAFLNNKLDLAQAESVADLIEATTEQAARSAIRSLQGEFSGVVHELVNSLIHLRMLTEAMLDFPDEEIDQVDFQQLHDELAQLLSSLEQIQRVANQGSLLREGAHVVLVGQPNVGKSSLLNKLSGEEVALVSDVPGTTRDVIRHAIHLNGVPFHILDTAGIRDAQDKVEILGIERTHGALQKADLVLLLVDVTNGLGSEENQILQVIPRDVPCIRVFNKIDITDMSPYVELVDHGWNVYVSALTGAGCDLLKNKLLEVVGWHQESGVYMARERHLRALFEAHEHLNSAVVIVEQMELFAEELRYAQNALNSITGEFSSDDLLGEIFNGFCIGK